MAPSKGESEQIMSTKPTDPGKFEEVKKQGPEKTTTSTSTGGEKRQGPEKTSTSGNDKKK